jgi:hypothetical protein
MANDYTTNTEIKAVMPDTNWSTTYDALLTTIITRASRAIDLFTGREPGAFSVNANTTRYYDGSGNKILWVDELAELPSTVAVAETGVVDNASGTGGTYTVYSTSDYFPWPYNALAERKPFLKLELDQLNGSKYSWYKFPRSVKITGKFGYTTTTSLPPEIVQTTIIQAIRWFKRGQQAYQDVGAIVELGQLRYVQALDPDIKEMIMHLRKVTI